MTLRSGWGFAHTSGRPHTARALTRDAKLAGLLGAFSAYERTCQPACIRPIRPPLGMGIGSEFLTGEPPRSSRLTSTFASTVATILASLHKQCLFQAVLSISSVSESKKKKRGGAREHGDMHQGGAALFPLSGSLPPASFVLILGLPDSTGGVVQNVKLRVKGTSVTGPVH